MCQALFLTDGESSPGSREVSLMDEELSPHPSPLGGALRLWLGVRDIKVERDLAGIMSETLECISCSNSVISDIWVQLKYYRNLLCL